MTLSRWAFADAGCRYPIDTAAAVRTSWAAACEATVPDDVQDRLRKAAQFFGLHDLPEFVEPPRVADPPTRKTAQLAGQDVPVNSAAEVSAATAALRKHAAWIRLADRQEMAGQLLQAAMAADHDLPETDVHFLCKQAGVGDYDNTLLRSAMYARIALAPPDSPVITDLRKIADSARWQTFSMDYRRKLAAAVADIDEVLGLDTYDENLPSPEDAFFSQVNVAEPRILLKNAAAILPRELEKITEAPLRGWLGDQFTSSVLDDATDMLDYQKLASALPTLSSDDAGRFCRVAELCGAATSTHA